MPHCPAHQVTWHQDAGLSPSGAPNTAPAEERERAFGLDSMVNCWMPLVDADRVNGCMKFIPKTHEMGCVKHVIMGKYREQQRAVHAGAAGALQPQTKPGEAAAGAPSESESAASP